MSKETNLFGEQNIAELSGRIFLTEKWLYLRGKKIRRGGFGTGVEEGFSVCKLTELTDTSYSFIKYPIFLILCIVFLIFGLYSMQQRAPYADGVDISALGLFGFGLIFLVLYFFLKGFLLEFHYPGGMISTFISNTDKHEVEKFQQDAMSIVNKSN